MTLDFSLVICILMFLSIFFSLLFGVSQITLMKVMIGLCCVLMIPTIFSFMTWLIYALMQVR